MPDTYDSQVAKDVDKSLLEQLRVELDVTHSALRLDECGLWELRGSRGRVTTWGDGSSYLVHVYERPSKRSWFYAKKRAEVAGCTLTQDAEREGVFRLLGRPVLGMEADLRELLGLRVAAHLTEAERAELVERLARARASAGNA